MHRVLAQRQVGHGCLELTGLQLPCSVGRQCATALASVGEDGLGHDGVHAPVAVDQLRHAKVDALRDDGVRLVLGQAVGRHHELARLRVRVRHRLVDGRRAVDVARVGGVGLEVVGLGEAVDDVLVGGRAQREVEHAHPRLGERGRLDERDLEGARDRGLYAGAVELRIALRHVCVSHREQRARHLDRVVHRRPLADALVVEVATRRHRRDRVDAVVRRGRQAHAAHVHVDWDLGLVRLGHVRDGARLAPAHACHHVREARVVVGHARARVLDVVAFGAVGVGDGGPGELVAERGVGLAVLLEELVDGHHLVVGRVPGERTRGVRAPIHLPQASQ